MGKTLVISQSVENIVRFNAGPFDPNRIIKDAKQIFAENDFSIVKSIEVLNQQIDDLSSDETKTDVHDFKANVRLVLKLSDAISV